MQRNKWNLTEFGTEYTIVPGGVAIVKLGEENVYGAEDEAAGSDLLPIQTRESPRLQ